MLARTLLTASEYATEPARTEAASKEVKDRNREETAAFRPDIIEGRKAYSKEVYGDALKHFVPLARQGNVAAMNHTGFMYERGLGVKKDTATAQRWYRKAARRGNDWATKRLEEITARNARSEEVLRKIKVRNAQKILNSLGYDAGSIDGVAGRKTEQAVRRFQRHMGSTQTGQITDRLLKDLRGAKEGYERPEANQSNPVRTTAQIKWCMREITELEAVRKRAAQGAKTQAFNARIRGYNARCRVWYRYYRGALGEAKRHTAKYKEVFSHSAQARW